MDHRFRFRILALEITSPKLTNKETGLERLSQLDSDMRNGAFFYSTSLISSLILSIICSRLRQTPPSWPATLRAWSPVPEPRLVA